MSDDEEEFSMVEHELYAIEHTDKPMVELEIARSVTGADRARISCLEGDLSDTKTELDLLRSKTAKQASVIASMQKVITSRDLSLQHCTSSLIETNTQFQEAQDTIKQLRTELQKAKDDLTQLEIQYELTRTDLQKECQEFKAFKQCFNKTRRTLPIDQVMATERKFINNLFEPGLFR
jgi:chromosome segregation ATPase